MGTPYFILASGQSNIQGQSAINWSPNARAKIWNNNEGDDSSVGTSYIAIQNTICGISQRYAHRVAAADVNKDVYLARVARGGRDILTWVGGGFFAFTGGTGDGTIVFNTTPSAATIIALSPMDVFGIRRPWLTVEAKAGDNMWVKQGSTVYKYVLTSNVDYGATLVTFYVSLVSITGSALSIGNVQVEFTPRLLIGIDNVVPAALAAAGKSTVDVFMWWQGESDAQYNTRYEAEFGAFLSAVTSRSWWGANTKLIICGINSTANNGYPWSDPFNTRLAAIAAGGANRYFANTAANVPAADWQDVYHMTGQGYTDAGDYVFNSVYAPPLIDPGGGTGTGTITGISVSAMTTVLDVTNNANHQVFPSPPAGYGLWTDGFPNPYRDGNGVTYLPIPHSENFRFRIPDWNNPAGWTLDPPTLVSARQAPESSYNNRHWIFGVHAIGNNVYALCHHEWYVEMTSSNGVPGFNANNPPGVLYNQRWVNAITYASSTNGGASFAVAPFNDSRRCVLIPEPWSIQSRNHMFGFFHPTNIVQEGGYYYAACEQRSLGAMVVPENGGDVGFCANSGMSLIRTTDLTSPLGWQFWNGSSWVGVNHATYQGNQSTQVPYRFFQSTNHNFYAVPNDFNSGIGHSIRYHPASGQWIIFGFTGGTAGARFGYTTSPTLANPQFNTITGVANSWSDDFEAPAGRYIGVFDPAATDQNFTNIGNVCTVLVQRDGALIRKGTLTISMASTAPTYSIVPTTTNVNEGGSVSFTVTTTNFGSGTLYWANVGSTTGADFSDGLNSGSVTITNNSGSFTRTLVNDVTTEGAETIVMQLRSGSQSGTLVATAPSVNVNDTSVPAGATYSVTPSTSSVNEGGTVNFTITTTNFGSGTLYWTNSGTTVGSDFSDGSNSGSVTITNNSGSISRTLLNDLSTEGSETIVLQLRTLSTSGTVVAIASTVTVNDTSVTPSTVAKFKVYAGNGSWIDAALASNFRFRSPDGLSWINRTGNLANLFVMNATKTAWIPFTTSTSPSTYSIAPSATSVNEGQTVTFTVTTTNFGSGTLYWANVGSTTGADFSDGLNSGSVTITNNSGLITRVVSNDGTTEGAETLIMQLRTGSTSGTIVATASTVTLNDTSGPSTPTYAIAVSVTDVSEGQPFTLTVTTTGVANGTVLYWTNSGTSTAADYTDGLNSGSVTINNNTATFARITSADSLAEGNETAIIQLRTGSTSGTIVATAPTVTIYDTSVPAGPTYAISASTTSVNEGGTVTFPITTTNFGSGTLYWTNSGTTTGADFSGGLNSGAITITNNSGSLSRTLVNDVTAEGAESIIIRLRTGSTSGTIVATSPTVTVNDTSVPAAPTLLTMNRNDLDFYYFPAKTSTSDQSTLDFRVTIDTANFFNKAVNADDHILFALDTSGQAGNNNPHCGPIYRNGQNIFVLARGFIITRNHGVMSEVWNGTFSPVLASVANTSGQTFNPVSGVFTIRIRAGYRAGAYANLMTISITSGSSIYDPVVFQGSAGVGWDWTGTHTACLGAISLGFVPPSATGCVETSATGPAYGGYLPFSGGSISVY